MTIKAPSAGNRQSLFRQKKKLLRMRRSSFHLPTLDRAGPRFLKSPFPTSLAAQPEQVENHFVTMVSTASNVREGSILTKK